MSESYLNELNAADRANYSINYAASRVLCADDLQIGRDAWGDAFLYSKNHWRALVREGPGDRDLRLVPIKSVKDGKVELVQRFSLEDTSELVIKGQGDSRIKELSLDRDSLVRLYIAKMVELKPVK
ncbi:MAG: hypothetical protein J6T57_00280 [Alphaproteobacteria bacterium]|nr:hypothetical protein [Alphaproteobacteria bacterium]